LKSLFNEEKVIIKYIDDENEQVGIKNQDDLDYALRVKKTRIQKLLH
jgi:hypothetical protein